MQHIVPVPLRLHHIALLHQLVDLRQRGTDKVDGSNCLNPTETICSCCTCFTPAARRPPASPAGGHAAGARHVGSMLADLSSLATVPYQSPLSKFWCRCRAPAAGQSGRAGPHAQGVIAGTLRALVPHGGSSSQPHNRGQWTLSAAWCCRGQDVAGCLGLVALPATAHLNQILNTQETTPHGVVNPPAA